MLTLLLKQILLVRKHVNKHRNQEHKNMTHIICISRLTNGILFRLFTWNLKELTQKAAISMCWTNPHIQHYRCELRQWPQNFTLRLLLSFYVGGSNYFRTPVLIQHWKKYKVHYPNNCFPSWNWIYSCTIEGETENNASMLTKESIKNWGQITILAY